MSDEVEGLGTNIEGPVTKIPRAKPVKTLPGTVRIVLEEDDNISPSGQFFGINGRSYLLRAGEEADVPRAIIDVLNNAVMSVPTLDPQTKQVVGYRERLRYPYRVIN